MTSRFSYPVCIWHTFLVVTLGGCGAATTPALDGGDQAGRNAGDAFGAGDSDATDDQGDVSTQGDTSSAGDDHAAPSLALESPDRILLPFGYIDDLSPTVEFSLVEVGGVASAEAIVASIEGPFSISGNFDAIGANESRTLSLGLDASVEFIPGVFEGTLTLNVDGQSYEIALGAALGHEALPPWPGWQSDDSGRTVTLSLPSAPFPHEGSPWTDDSVMINVPHTLRDDGTLGIVVHLHGHNAELASVVNAQHLRKQFALSGRNAVFVVPQGPKLAASGDFGKLIEPGGLRRLVDDVLTILYASGEISRATIGPVVLTSHSGGYWSLATLIAQGGIEVSQAHLFDSLYGFETNYRDWVTAGGTLRSSYTASGGTGDNNIALASELSALDIDVSSSFADEALATQPMIIGPSPAGHSQCVWAERNFARWLRHSPILPAPAAPIELLSAVVVENQAEITWRDLTLPADGPLRYEVRGSSNGVSWSTLTSVLQTTALVEPHAWLEVTVVDEPQGLSPSTLGGSDRYGATGNDWLVVDAFDRVIGGSYTGLTHNFAARIGTATGDTFSVASNEAVAEHRVSLVNFGRVIWLLGDESSLDVTFADDERTAIEDYLAAGGEFIVSGSEVGFATDASWLGSALHASHVSDDAQTTFAGGFEFGVTYDEDYPDVLSGDDTIWTYATGGAAAVGWQNKVVVVGFALETLADEDATTAMGELKNYLDGE